MSSHRNPNANVNWETPGWLVDRIHEFQKIGLDPATTKENPTRAEYIRTAECSPDGLETDWCEFDGLVFVNPPYRKVWYDKILSTVMQATSGIEMLALLPAKPGTNYFQNLAMFSESVCFIRGRLTFRENTEPAPFENAMLYFGKQRGRFIRTFSQIGWVP